MQTSDQPRVPALFDLTGRNALITGGASFLGYDMAEALSEAGARVAVTSRDRARAIAAAERLVNGGGHAIGIELDVTRDESVAGAAATATERLGPIDILINNAGGGSSESAAELTRRDTAVIRRMIEVNLTGTLLMCRAVADGMMTRGTGKIINIASIAGLVGRDRQIYADAGMAGQPIDYAAAKAGVIGATRDLAAWLGPHGICVNAISPGGFGPRRLPDRFVADYARKVPVGRMGRDTVDIKGAALFLAAAASDYVNGHNLVVDGGFSVWK